MVEMEKQMSAEWLASFCYMQKTTRRQLKSSRLWGLSSHPPLLQDSSGVCIDLFFGINDMETNIKNFWKELIVMQ